MKKIITIVVLIILAAAAYLTYAHLSGGAIPTFGLPIGGQKAEIRKTTNEFFEHIKFQNTDAMHAYVKQDVTKEELNKYLERFFQVDLAIIDLTQVVIDNIELNTSKKRARVRVSVQGRNLSTTEPITVNKIIYLSYEQDRGWIIDINHLSP